MKPFFSFLIIVLTLTPSFSASAPELSSPLATAEKQASTTLTLSELIQEGKEMQASIIEGGLLSLMLRFDGLTERGNHYATFTRYLTVHAAKCENPELHFPGYEIILEDMRANPDSQAAAEAQSDMRELIQLAKSGSLSPNVLQSAVEKLNERKVRDLAVRKEVIAQNKQKLALATFFNDRLIGQLRKAFGIEIKKLRKFRDSPTIDKWELESPISTGIEDNPTAELPNIATLIRDIKEYSAEVAKQETEYLESTRSRLLANTQKIDTLLKKALAAEPLADEAKRSILEGMIKALSADIRGNRELY
jgi:hypothetical protein